MAELEAEHVASQRLVYVLNAIPLMGMLWANGRKQEAEKQALWQLMTSLHLDPKTPAR